jgi:hypothetical protein
MAFPAGLQLVSVHGRIDSLPSGGAAGQARFDRPVALVGGVDNSIVPARPEYVTLDASGEFTISLPATNDPQWTPQDWAYAVEIVTSSGVVRGTLQLDYQTAAVELADLLQVDGAASTGVTYATLAQLNTGLSDLSADLMAMLPVEPRLVTAGEYVIPRSDIITESPLTSGNLYVTHFTAAATEEVQSVRTGIGGTVATGATHAWIGVASWDGSGYTPLAASVDDPTRWAASFQTYDTQLYQWDHAGEAGFEGFDKAYGQEYALWVLWIGSGTAPALPAGGGWYAESLEEPRTNAYIGSQTQPPAAPLSGAFFGPDSRRFQGLLKR